MSKDVWHFTLNPVYAQSSASLARIQNCKFQSATTCKDVLPGLYLGANSKPLTRAPYFGANTMLSTLFHLPRKNTGGPFWCVYHVSAICCLDLKIGYLHKYFGIVEKIPFVISSAMLIQHSHFKIDFPVVLNPCQYPSTRIPRPSSSQKPPSADISKTESGIIDPLVSKR